MKNIVLLDKDDLKDALKAAIREFYKEKENREAGDKLYTINQVAKKLGKAHRTIKKLVQAGVIRSTKNGLIPHSAVEEYINGN